MENIETNVVSEVINEREKKIEELCNQVINITFDTYYDTSKGKEITVCPLCGEYTDTHDKTKVEHKPSCAFLTAKELLNVS